jgi:excisionase family DNA binding protein
MKSRQITDPNDLQDSLPDPLLEPTIDVERAASLLGIGRTKAYELARAGRFPVPLLACGRRYRVPSAPLLDALGLSSRVGVLSR